MAKRVGFIGLGAMGSRMARNLLGKGFSLTVYDLREEAVAELVGAGAVGARSPREVARDCPLVLLSLPGPREVEEVVLGVGGLLEGAGAGSIWVNLSTVDPATNRNLASRAVERGVRVLGAPVSGGIAGAEAATLCLMVGGERGAFQECREVLEAIGSRIYYLGEIGAGDVVKLVNNLITSVTIGAVAEALVLGVKAGVPLQSMLPVLAASGASSFILDKYMGPRLLKRDFEPGMRIHLQRKDAGLILALAQEHDYPLLFGGLAHQVFTQAQARGLGDKDFTALVTLFEEMAGPSVEGGRGLVAKGKVDDS